MRAARGRVLALSLALAAPIAWSIVRASAPGPDPRGAYAAALGFATQELVEVDHAACVSIANGGATQDPEEALMKQIASRGAVVVGSQCRTGDDAVTVVDSRRPAVALTALSIDPVADGEVWVDVRYFRTRRFSGIRTYRVVREADAWVALGQVLRDGPL